MRYSASTADVDPPDLLVQLERLLREAERLDVRVDRRRALRGLPRVLRGFLGHLADQVVVRERGIELLELIGEDRLVCGGDAAVQLDAPSHEQRVVRDLLHDRVLEAVAALAPFTRRGLEHEVGGDELVHGGGETVAAGLAQHTVAEALADHGGELDALPSRRRQAVDARSDDRVERRGYFERRRTLAEMPLAARVLLRRARLDQRPQRLLDEERIAAGAGDDPVTQLIGDPVEALPTMRAASSSESGSSTSWLKFVRDGFGSGDPGPRRCASRNRIGTREARDVRNQSRSSDAASAKCRSSRT